MQSLSAEGLNTHSLILPDGEHYKTLAILERIYDRLLALRFDRSCTLIALGGGVIGDMTGFAAASYQRGVNFIQIPTTLLSQVDSSVGGKTGVNHPLGKNMIGAFHQPQTVIADITTLTTLDDRQLAAGLAEVIKYGLLIDHDFHLWLKNNMALLLQRDSTALSYAIERSCQIKAAVVCADEREKGQRALLNLGHTFGHAIETGMGYGNWLHGEAVAVGMCMAADLSQRLGWISEQDKQECINIVRLAGLPCKAPSEISEQEMLDLMAQDKKVKDNTLNLILFKAIGQTVVSSEFSEQDLRACIKHCR
jgi:3-dehydroquinate synthase